MDTIFEILAEVFAEVFYSWILSASAEIVPYKKLSQKKREKYKFISVAISVLFLILLIIGGAISAETKGQSVLGRILIGFPIVYFLTTVVLIIKKLIKRTKK